MLDWIKNHMINKDRCGYSPFRTGPWDPFHDACRVHDENYVAKKITRDEADEIFFSQVKEIIRDSPWYVRPVKWIWGHAYMGIVKLYGKAVWDN